MNNYYVYAHQKPDGSGQEVGIKTGGNTMLEKAKKAYSEIFELVEKCGDLCIFDTNELKRKSKCHLLGIELREKYNIDIDPKKIQSPDYNRFGDYMSIGHWGEKYRRTISWSDNGIQPEDELLLSISFPTGAYIFGDDYPTHLFDTFFDELKTYCPKYIDTHNNGLYFSMDKAGNVFNNFKNIMDKYRELNKEDFKQRKIIKLKEELDKLQGIVK